MKTYRTRDTEIEELGELRLNRILGLIQEVASDPDQSVQVGIGIYRSEKDFLEIRPVGNNDYLLWSDYIALPFWKRLLTSSHIQQVVSGIDAVETAITLYRDKPRREFESHYR